MLLTKQKISSAKQRQRREDRIACIRLRMAVGYELSARGVTTPAEMAEALGMPAAEAQGLLTRRQWREGEVARLQAAAARLGLTKRDPGEQTG
jgi:hypothetical protein